MADTCKLCRGQLLYVGELGRLLWLICRNCGMFWSQDKGDTNHDSQ